MIDYTVREAAALLGVSDDTVRRWGEAGRIEIAHSAGGRQSIDGRELARTLLELGAESPLAEAFPAARVSARNRFTGVVTAVQKDGVMAQIDIQAGPFRVVSLMSREAADELGLEVGVLAVASAKATTVTVEIPKGNP